MKIISSISICFIVIICLFSCKKESFITSEFARVNISSDTLIYDTVFTTTGSITKSFKILNDNNQKLKLTRVKLMGGTSSAYKMNVDGISSPEVNNVEINANDSVYVFVSVTINPNAANLPFVVRDSIQINYNGVTRFVQLQAYGQNANFLRNIRITANTTWNKTLPYVILGGVTVDPSVTLTINPGTRIYLHANAPLIVDGTLNASGTKADSIVFRGDRMDPDYKDLPASWPGIIFRKRSKDNVLKFCQILNAYQGLVLDSLSINANPKVRLSQSIINNIYDAGILAVNSDIAADNCLITNCGSNVILAYGGNYNFTHCTIVSYSNTYFGHSSPVFQVSNFAAQGTIFLTNNLTAILRNNIFWGDFGNVEDELLVLKQPGGNYNVTLENNLYKAVHDPSNATVQSANIKNAQPGFDSINVSRRIFNFHFNKNLSSPAINSGKVTSFTRDLDNKPRAVGLPDMGCYERQ